MFTFYPGLSPSNVNKDAKYSVVHSPGGGMEVRLVYRISAREKELLTNDRHERLVAMVNEVKEKINGAPGGAFYINEYRDVLVPHRDGGCVYAGTYEEILEFDYDGQSIGPVPPPSLGPGDPWPGPHAGIPYVLRAGGTDIKYDMTTGRRIREVHLSDEVGQEPARLLARRLAAVKGHAGGRVYINEASHFFAPLNTAMGNATYVYLGALDDDAWFTVPDVPGRL
ncbi:hypothetical protein [Micromonospora sp. RTP1Z1]|uniref:hypothetical protein n=1 Tax=Micromonospora sp. RTP1Z1 TaxID=2994043 RepID=UPI0029C769E4|nr:hypothetical protein [Micromonospora sp. RTP1Z1]